MRFILLLVLVFVSLRTVAQHCASETNRVVLKEDIHCDDRPWQLTFEDHFNAESIDTTQWKVIEGVVRGQSHTLEKQWYSPDNVVLRDGVLNLEARRHEEPIKKSYSVDDVPYNESFTYTSGEIHLKQPFAHGKFEIRARIPKGKGFWPAFWLWGNWPTTVPSEIDMFEFWNRQTMLGWFSRRLSVRTLATNIHYPGGKRYCQVKYVGPDYSADFHIFTLIWTPLRIEFQVDGKTIRKHARYYKTYGVPADCPLKAGEAYIEHEIHAPNYMNLILNMAIQSERQAPNKRTPFPAVYEIDYVKVWQKNSSPSGELMK